MTKADVLIIGSGVAALQLAKRLRDDKNVIIITKSFLKNGNSNLAQGGIAAAIGKNDHPDSHFADTLEAGGFHNDRAAVLAVTKEAPDLIEELSEEGCRFDTDEQGGLLLGMEGAHSENRIVHGGGDATGRRIMEHLASAAAGKCTIFENTFVFDLIIDSSGRCIGAKGKNADGNIESFFANHVVLATGGCGQLYSHTSNAETVTGDGIALAYKAGAEIADMEFVQFHPTLLYLNGKTHGLISEAVRGDGGRLVTEAGVPIMEGVHPMGDLAPRHIVAQKIYDYLREGTSIYLDVSAIKNFAERFPTITALCEKNHVEWKSRIPVAPGSHFLMGGVKTDLIGRTSIKGLYAIGEAACTGLHGANRLASNSLLEGLFMGKKLSEWINEGRRDEVGIEFTEIRRPLSGCIRLPEIKDIKRTMMENTGIVRSEEGLLKQKRWLESFQLEEWLNADLGHLNFEEMTRAFMLITSWLITDSALKRTESRGGHFRSDHPCEKNHDWMGRQIIQKRNDQNEQIETAVAT
ncbi:L-aspartate oxidase [Siminovitchia fortis]|uniref:L-aspartate oxidase n=1 Tax=Siminovitchia fortis TaxID=254758 RepID=A0A443INU9_9BACI|nr:L-aspartate oxidase [Siminovitchia fortis]RWR08096.1 L-aspartate oxidase [Siminovitchia fortis]WHY81052.1 L-aspartate oxidase [Siminovitchia fortis]